MATSQSQEERQRVSTIEFSSDDDRTYTRRFFYSEECKIEKYLTIYEDLSIIDYGIVAFKYSGEGKVESIINSSVNSYECAIFSHNENNLRVYKVNCLLFDATRYEFEYSIRSDGVPYKEVFASLPPETSQYTEYHYLAEDYKYIIEEITIYPDLQREPSAISKDEVLLLLETRIIGKIVKIKGSNFVIYNIEMIEGEGYPSFYIRISYEVGDSNYDCIVK